MEDLASLLRFMQLYAHMMHNICYGSIFMQDHSHFGDLYAAYEARYDDVIERMIGLGQNPDIVAINVEAANELSHYKNSSNDEGFDTLLKYEEALQKQVDRLCESCSEGTRQLIGDIANESEMRCYKIKQRLQGAQNGSSISRENETNSNESLESYGEGNDQ